MTNLNRWALRLMAFWIASTACAAGTDHVQVELISEVGSVRPESSFWVGVEMDMQPHWHIYWTNPGESGYPTTIEWDLPEGLTAGEIVWPVPTLFDSQGVAGIGYEDKAVLLTEITADSNVAVGSTVEMKAKVAWLECKEMCIPGDADVSISLPVQAVEPKPTHVESFKAARATAIAESNGWTVQAHVEGDLLVLDVEVADGVKVEDGSLQFFPYQEGMLDYLATQTVEQNATEFELRCPLSKSEVRWPESDLGGLLIHEKGWDGSGERQALSFSVPFDKDQAPSVAVKSNPSAASSMGLGGALFAAFLGGLILNLMPCVFPVISLKILGFVKQAESSPAHVWHHGITFALGVLVSFWVLAGTLLILKSAGEAVGWGFQLQSPAFVVGMSVLFLLIAMNLFGVFEIGTSLTGVGQEASAKEGYTGSFFSGVLATIVATPCTAPFMAGALGVALTQPTWAAMTIFTFLGLGMATPYLFLSRFPNWLKKIPKPGAWMESMKQGMGFMILAFTLYLVWVYDGQRGNDGLFRLLAGLLIVGVGGWVLGRWGGLAKSSATRWVARVAMVACIVAGTWVGISMPKVYGWIPYAPEQVEALTKDGKPVFVDFTAQWCLTCQANKKIALNRDDVQARFRELAVTTMKADWTDRNETIARKLEEFGRSGVPLYVLYSGKDGDAPVLLPELLTPAIVLNALDEALDG